MKDAAVGLYHIPEGKDSIGMGELCSESCPCCKDDGPSWTARRFSRLYRKILIQVRVNQNDRQSRRERMRRNQIKAPTQVSHHHTGRERFTITCISSADSTGLGTCVLYPALRARSRSSGRAKAVSAIAGIFPPRSEDKFRTFRRNS